MLEHSIITLPEEHELIVMLDLLSGDIWSARGAGLDIRTNSELRQGHWRRDWKDCLWLSLGVVRLGLLSEWSRQFVALGLASR